MTTSATTASGPAATASNGPSMVFWGALVVMWGWFFFILTGEWEANEQYSHGWFIPILAGYIFWQRWNERPAPEPATGSLRVWCYAVLAVLVLPSAAGILIAGAYPDWRLVLWGLGIAVFLASLALTALAGGMPWVRQFSFAFVFAMVAIPWPTAPERWLTQELSLLAAKIAAWALPMMGIAAMCHGTTIDVGTETLGVDDACSGIRSFQSSLMAALFLGELYRLRWGYRIFLCLVGLFTAYALNVLRMIILSVAVANGGLDALNRLHDPAGFAILLVTMGILWVLCWRILKRPGSVQPSVQAPKAGGVHVPVFASAAVIAAVVLMVAASEGWYQWKAQGVERSAAWTIPAAEPGSGVSDSPLSKRVHDILRFDSGFERSWRDEAGHSWHLIYVDWLPKRMSLHYAQAHLPEQCQTMIGRVIVSKSEMRRTMANGISIPYYLYKIRAGSDEFFLMYVVSDDRIGGKLMEPTRPTSSNRIAAVLAGRRNMGQRSMQLALVGEKDEARAEVAMLKLLPKLVQPAPQED